jgi:hypothetical protein
MVRTGLVGSAGGNEAKARSRPLGSATGAAHAERKTREAISSLSFSLSFLLYLPRQREKELP